MGVPTYDTIHLLHNEIKSNTMEVLSNIGGGQQGYLRLVVSPTTYAILTKNPFVRQVHPEKLIIPIAATHNAQEELKHQYEKNLRVFHKTEGAEQALIQKLVLAVEAIYITVIRNRITRKFTGNILMLIQYLIFTCG